MFSLFLPIKLWGCIQVIVLLLVSLTQFIAMYSVVFSLMYHVYIVKGLMKSTWEIIGSNSFNSFRVNERT